MQEVSLKFERDTNSTCTEAIRFYYIYWVVLVAVMITQLKNSVPT